MKRIVSNSVSYVYIFEFCYLILVEDMISKGNKTHTSRLICVCVVIDALSLFLFKKMVFDCALIADLL